MKIYYNHIPSSHYIQKISNLIPEQSLNESVSVYEEAIPYIQCQIQSTIQHEAGHRQDEASSHRDIETGKDVSGFEEFVSENWSEPIAEKEEEDCDLLAPEQLSGKTILININQLFENAKSISKIDPAYKKDIKAGTLSFQRLKECI